MLLVDMLIAVPFAAAVVAAVAGRNARWAGLAASIALVGIVAYLGLDGGFATPTSGWTPSASQWPAWGMTLDGVSAPLVSLTALLSVIAVLASWHVEDRPGAHHALILALVGAVMGVFLAQDIFVFYVFWEAVLIPMFFLIGLWGHENRKHAAMKFFLYTFAGSVLMFIGILVAVFATGMTSISDLTMAAGELPADLVFWLLVIGMLVKIPVVPLHTWLPDAHVEAPTAGSILLAGVLLKMGGYALIRIALPIAPVAFAQGRVLFAILGIVGIVYGASMALAQKDLKRLVAYSSVAHMGFVLLAIAAGTEIGLQAAMLGMISHGLVAALMFLLVGILYERTHTRQISRFGGLGRLMPVWATAMTFGALASLGLPGLSGFPGEFGSVVAGFSEFGWWILPVGVGVVLGGAYNLRAVRLVNQGPVAPEWSGISDIKGIEWVPVSLLGATVILLGAWPSLVTDICADGLAAIASMLGGVL
jgi:NADH-quinone oxidoreductase subunit M